MFGIYGQRVDQHQNITALPVRYVRTRDVSSGILNVFVKFLLGLISKKLLFLLSGFL